VDHHTGRGFRHGGEGEREAEHQHTPTGTHQENHPIESKGFKGWLHSKFRELNGRSPKDADLENAAKALAYTALENGKQHEIYSRVGWEGWDTVWVDLCTPDWSAVRITAEGWSVEPGANIKFRRGPLLGPLPTPFHGPAPLSPNSSSFPERRGGWADLRPLVNVPSDDWPLILGFLTACFLPPPAIFPILYLCGQSGAGKNILTLQLLSFVDPRLVALRGAIPQEEETVLLSAQKNLLQVSTNLSSVSTAQSDMFCRLKDPSRMHTLIRWVVAAEPSFGVEPDYKLGDFRRTYDRSLQAGQGVAMEVKFPTVGGQRESGVLSESEETH
jgi:hypothetical protein